MKGMVLCAGFGKRLAPLTGSRAKPAIPFLNKPFVVRVLEDLHRSGLEEAVINLHHLPGSLRALSASFPPGMAVHFVEESKRILGTAGGLKNAEAHFADGTFLLVNSDIFFRIDLTRAIEFHKKRAALATMVLKRNHDPAYFAPVLTDCNQRVVAIAGRPSGAPIPDETTSCLFTGIHILEPGILDAIPKGEASDINADVYPKLIAKGMPVLGYITDEYWCEAGTLERFLDASRSSIEALSLEGPLVGLEAVRSPEASVDRFSVIGRGARIERGATITGSILFEDVRAGAGCLVNNCIIDRGVAIEPEREVENQCISFRVETGQMECVTIR